MRMHAQLKETFFFFFRFLCQKLVFCRATNKHTHTHTYTYTYTHTQVTAFQLENYWCEPKSIEEIRQHSKEYDLPFGDTQGCWSTISGVKCCVV